MSHSVDVTVTIKSQALDVNGTSFRSARLLNIHSKEADATLIIATDRHGHVRSLQVGDVPRFAKEIQAIIQQWNRAICNGRFDEVRAYSQEIRDRIELFSLALMAQALPGVPPPTSLLSNSPFISLWDGKLGSQGYHHFVGHDDGEVSLLTDLEFQYLRPLIPHSGYLVRKMITNNTEVVVPSTSPLGQKIAVRVPNRRFSFKVGNERFYIYAVHDYHNKIWIRTSDPSLFTVIQHGTPILEWDKNDALLSEAECSLDSLRQKGVI